MNDQKRRFGKLAASGLGATLSLMVVGPVRGQSAPQSVITRAADVLRAVATVRTSPQQRAIGASITAAPTVLVFGLPGWSISVADTGTTMLIDPQTSVVRQYDARPATALLHGHPPPRLDQCLSAAAASWIGWRYLGALTGRSSSFGLVLEELRDVSAPARAGDRVWDALYARVTGGVPWYDGDFAHLVFDGVTGRLLHATCLFQQFRPGPCDLDISQRRAVAVAHGFLVSHKSGCALAGSPWSELYLVLPRVRDARGRLSGYKAPRLAWVVKYPATFADGAIRQSGYVEVWVAAGNAHILERSDSRLMGAFAPPPSGGRIGAIMRASVDVRVSPASAGRVVTLTISDKRPERFFGALSGVRTASHPPRTFVADSAVKLISRGGAVHHLWYDSATGLLSENRSGYGALAYAGPAFQALVSTADRRPSGRLGKSNAG